MDLTLPTDKNVLFKVSLSNGETFYEGKGMFEFRPGEPSPIQRLIGYMAARRIHITSLALLTRDGREYHLPSRSSNPRFQAFAQAGLPLDYSVYRKIGNDVKVGAKTDHFTVAEAFYKNYSLQIWVNEDKPHTAYTLVVPKE